jgi:hypothetical protein
MLNQVGTGNIENNNYPLSINKLRIRPSTAKSPTIAKQRVHEIKQPFLENSNNKATLVVDINKRTGVFTPKASQGSRGLRSAKSKNNIAQDAMIRFDSINSEINSHSPSSQSRSKHLLSRALLFNNFIKKRELINRQNNELKDLSIVGQNLKSKSFDNKSNAIENYNPNNIHFNNYDLSFLTDVAKQTQNPIVFKQPKRMIKRSKIRFNNEKDKNNIMRDHAYLAEGIQIQERLLSHKKHHYDTNEAYKQTDKYNHYLEQSNDNRSLQSSQSSFANTLQAKYNAAHSRNKNQSRTLN